MGRIEKRRGPFYVMNDNGSDERLRVVPEVAGDETTISAELGDSGNGTPQNGPRQSGSYRPAVFVCCSSVTYA